MVPLSGSGGLALDHQPRQPASTAGLHQLPPRLRRPQGTCAHARQGAAGPWGRGPPRSIRPLAGRGLAALDAAPGGVVLHHPAGVHSGVPAAFRRTGARGCGARGPTRARRLQRAEASARWFPDNGFVDDIYYQGFGESGLDVATGDEVDEAQNLRALYLVAAESRPPSRPRCRGPSGHSCGSRPAPHRVQ